MSGRKNKKTVGKRLRKQKTDPIHKVRVMQINSAITVPFVPVSTNTSTSVTKAASTTSSGSDETALQITSPTFSALVEEAKTYPEVRSQVVAAYTAQVASGHYPPSSVISGLADLLSGTASSSDSN
jgi:hypothetical protein